jgi:hypothetical protein
MCGCAFSSVCHSFLPLALSCIISVLSIVQVEAQDKPTPLAGEEFRTEVLGEQVEVLPRDRKTVTAASFGVQYLHDGPSFYQVLPFGAFYVWRHSGDNNERFRGSFAMAVNDLAYNVGIRSLPGWELRFTLNNMIIPLGRAEYVEGQIIRDVEVEWNYVFAGFGLAYRKLLSPGHQDNALELSLTYEPGYRWFRGSGDASPNFVVPADTYEGRVHLRLRNDALDRNLMELPHRGYAFGGDFFYGHRAKWGPWGGVAFDNPDTGRERDYIASSFYALAAGGVPWIENERHRLIVSFYGGIGQDLDRFSAFRLPGRPTGYEWEALALPILPSVAFNELVPTRYAIVHATYQYEAFFFLYPYIRGTYGLVEQPRFQPGGRIQNQMDAMPAISAGLVSGAPWRSQIEVNYSYNFGIFSDRGGGPPITGRHGFFVFWSKEFR